MKCDPYINVDPNMNPFQHGEVYVTDDGAETDLDLVTMSVLLMASSLRKIILLPERYIIRSSPKNVRGISGKTVQIIPHINEIKENIKKVAFGKKVDVVIVEIGGTAGDIESLPFLEAIRQLRQEMARAMRSIFT